MKPISEETCSNILSLVDIGLSSRQIEAQLGVSRPTVSRIRAKSRQGAQRSRGGRPAKLTAADKRRLVRMVTSGKVDTAVQLAQELRDNSEVKLSAETVRRTLKEAGRRAMVKKKTRRLLPRHIRQRL